MDPITQAAFGATWAGAAVAAGVVDSKDANDQSAVGTLLLLGALTGMAPDLDVFIRSSTDPMLALEFHRQFTHSLLFIPFGALICAGVFFAFLRRRLGFRQTLLTCLFAYASHGVLDACTTYGTLLLWPFADLRVAWNNISVVDPFFTVPVLTMVVLAVRRRRPHWTLLGLAWALSYLSFGVWQSERAEAAAAGLAAERGHGDVSAVIDAKPAFASLLVFKTVYEHEGVYYVDAVRTGLTARVIEGESVPRLVLDRDLPWLDADSQQAKDLERFRWFSADHLALNPQNSSQVIDIRYSMVPQRLDPLWAIEVSESAAADQHVIWRPMRGDGADRLSDLWDIWLDR